MSKYRPLGNYLRSQSAGEVPMSFAEIEHVIGAKLPRSAYEHRPWWSNNASNSAITKAWLAAGFRSARVDMLRRKLVFERMPGKRCFSEEGRMVDPKTDVQKKSGKPEQHPAIGALKGTFTIEAGWDLTRPALDPEELEAWEANLDRKADLLEKTLAGKRR